MESGVPSYQELTPSTRLADQVECTWIGIEAEIERNKVVTPDGCADIIYARQRGSSELFAVGPMTRYKLCPQSAASCSIGIRFRPGMWAEILRVNGPELTDRVVPLDCLWSERAGQLHRALDAADQPCAWARLLCDALPLCEKPRSAVQKAIGALESSRGCLSIDFAARQAGLSGRHFRRLARNETGFSPKLLARILRFRHATELLLKLPGEHAGLACECGYADQSHLISDFQEFAGQTPRSMAVSLLSS